ncbi:MAG: MFS transporter [Mycobacterium leprae]
MATSWGLFWGGWAALIPEIKTELALTDRQLGLALFAVPVAAVPAMLLTGRLARRLAQHTLPVGTAAFAAGIVLTGLAHSRPSFTAALLVVGASSGMIEVALNATTAAHEARDGRRLFNLVHAATPLAMLIAAPSVGLARELGASVLTVLTAIALLVAASVVLAIDSPGWQECTRPIGARPPKLYRPLLLVGALGASVLLMENAVEQWGAIHLEQQLRAGPLLASFAPAGYMAGLSFGRMLVQKKGAEYSDRTLVALGGTLGGTGLAIAATAWNPSVALIGFSLAGIGLGPVVPTLLSATARSVAPERRPSAISVVTTVSYAGFLCSPPLVGMLAAWRGLPAALGLVALGGALLVLGAHAVPSHPGRRQSPSPGGAHLAGIAGSEPAAPAHRGMGDQSD